MPFIDTHQLTTREPLPGWHGRFFSSERMTFGYYEVSAGAAIHPHAHPNEEVWHVLAALLGAVALRLAQARARG